ncbi:MAG: hypothetical protein RLZZ211_1383 [Bacteroidota bacterium]|jgi:toxin YoeB
MVENEIVWLPIANEQLEFILNYWNTKTSNAFYSNKILNKLYLKLITLQRYPHSAPLLQSRKVHKLAMRNYSIIYAVRSEMIYIFSFWDNRQDPNNLITILNNLK